ncbi:CheY-like superfamily, partial [Blastocladiella britannica]
IRVLLVEDNPINLHILTAFLSKRGIQYAAARDGESAVRMFTGAPPGSGNEFHLVLMDLQLPVMDGIEASRLIRAQEDACQPMSVVPRFRSIVVALTASSSQEDRRRAIAGGCNDFISKPI